MVLYYWDKYNTNSTTSTTYVNDRITTYGSSSASISAYPGYTFTSSGGFQTYGSSYSPAVGDTVYAALSRTVMIEYYVKSKVGSTSTYDFWRHECDTSTGTVYSRGSYITTITAESYAYTDDARNSDGYWYVRGSQVPDNPPPTDPPPSVPTGVSVSQGYLYPNTELFISWNSVSGVNLAGSGYYAVQNVTTGQTQTLIKSTSLTWTGLTTGTTYGFKVAANKGDGTGWSDYSSTVYGTTSSSPPSSPTNFRIRSQDTTSINLEWDASNGATSYSVEVYNQGTTTNPVSQNYGITGTTKYISGLTSGKTYDIKLYAVNGSGNSIPVWMYNVAIGKPRPSNWSWSTLSPSANTYTSGGKLKVNLVSSGDWNQFCNRINAFRDFKNLNSYTFSSATSTSDFTSGMYSEAVIAINPMVSSVDQSGGFYTKLINLQTALNSIS